MWLQARYSEGPPFCEPRFEGLRPWRLAASRSCYAPNLHPWGRRKKAVSRPGLVGTPRGGASGGVSVGELKGNHKNPTILRVPYLKTYAGVPHDPLEWLMEVGQDWSGMGLERCFECLPSKEKQAALKQINSIGEDPVSRLECQCLRQSSW